MRRNIGIIKTNDEMERDEKRIFLKGKGQEKMMWSKSQP